MELENIERFFLTALLRISMVGVLLILIADTLLYPQDTLSVTIDCIILTACVVSYFIRLKYTRLAVLTITTIVMGAMFYQCLSVPVNTTTSLSILLIEGFIISIMLKGWLMWTMHGINFVAINVIFAIQFFTPSLRFSQKPNDVVTVAITYSILYFILAYATGVLKFSYDKANKRLVDLNIELHQKANEIEAQNEELIQIQDNLSTANNNLEMIVKERTEKLRVKTEKLIAYSYANAHHLRGPVARLLGLIHVHELETNPNPSFFFSKMKDQAMEIDNVVKQINVELGDL